MRVVGVLHVNLALNLPLHVVSCPIRLPATARGLGTKRRGQVGGGRLWQRPAKPFMAKRLQVMLLSRLLRTQRNGTRPSKQIKCVPTSPRLLSLSLSTPFPPTGTPILLCSLAPGSSHQIRLYLQPRIFLLLCSPDIILVSQARPSPRHPTIPPCPRFKNCNTFPTFSEKGVSPFRRPRR
jgi:hypothetical protein